MGNVNGHMCEVYESERRYNTNQRVPGLIVTSKCNECGAWYPDPVFYLSNVIHVCPQCERQAQAK
jgi:hypothetical protein